MTHVASYTHCFFVWRDPDDASQRLAFGTLYRITDINHKLKPPFFLHLFCENFCARFLPEPTLHVLSTCFLTPSCSPVRKESVTQQGYPREQKKLFTNIRGPTLINTQKTRPSPLPKGFAYLHNYKIFVKQVNEPKLA